MKNKDPSTIAEEDVVCKCFIVTEDVIRSCIKKNNLESIESVTKACEAGGGCHSCHILIQLFIDQHQGKSLPKEDMVALHGKKIKRKGILSNFLSRFK